MKKIISILLTLVILLSGISAVALPNIHNTHTMTARQQETVELTSPAVAFDKYSEEYTEIHLKDISTYLQEPGNPMLPKLVTTYELPFGARNIQIDITPETPRIKQINQPVRPAPIPIPLLPTAFETTGTTTENPAVYTTNAFYPKTWYTYRVGCGLNSDNEHVTYLSLHTYPVRYNPVENTIQYTPQIETTITYDAPQHQPFPIASEYDMVIITPETFATALEPLVDHKNQMGVQTFIKTTEEIYQQYSGFDKPEQIKYFIKDAVETQGVTYVLLAGGLTSLICSKPRDGFNQGTTGWHVPVRYNNLFDNPEHPLLASSIYDPGVISDLYYADIYEAGGNFSTWDPNEDGVYASMSRPGYENDTGIDMYPDVRVGRLAVRNKREIRNMIDKITTYERTMADPSWFKKMIVISGDGFLDQEDLDIQWDTTGLPDGTYTIHAQSSNPDQIYGDIDIINVTLDKTKATNLSINHDDHLKVDGYPHPPIAEITSVSEGDILGNTDFFYKPTEGEAYCNDFTGWSNINYEDNILHIRGKSYDPQPYGNITNLHIWIENSDHQQIFSAWRNNTEMYYEGEWVTGEKILQGKGGALSYMPADFEKEIIWTSNGVFTGQQDVIDSLSNGAGFVFFSGHGSPKVWGDHYPGVPGNRQYGSITGLVTMKLYGSPPYFPMSKIKNEDKPFILVVGGCHNSQFNVSLIPSLLDYRLGLSLWTYGRPAPECWSWWITRMAGSGAIASIGNTGLGYGALGKDCTISGLDGGISLDFFRQYAEEGHDILGDAYGETITQYLNTFDMEEDDHIKSVQQWVLLGDPSLKIGGYST